MSWREDRPAEGHRPADVPIYINDRHRTLHFAGIARDLAAYLPRENAVMLDYGCGEALCADRLAARCAKLYLCEGSPNQRTRLAARFAAEPKIAVIAPEDAEALPDHELDLVAVTSLLTHIPMEELDELLGLWHSKLREDGRLVLAGVVPHETNPLAEAAALLRFAGSGGFLAAALASLARDVLSGRAEHREEEAPARYDEPEMLALLRDRGFEGRRAERNLGHDQTRMTFVANPV
ncbi:class I SAM-dependent methyltransferase [Enterovirga sp.]|uniref:class I SAM-dependent methyltransferase n=1 Tax=Enterovirga sp. TaxID=2026350 RepID=UPI002C2A7439|nr:class I SAM-dependent methyltransferase [Enterovirga sp.]HMO30037.1 class I SAM-dependent methyltransferase [Enterovirga sp.]